MIPSINLAHNLLVLSLPASLLGRLDLAFRTVLDRGFGRMASFEWLWRRFGGGAMVVAVTTGFEAVGQCLRQLE
jgi:hypothetical protein